MKKGHAKRALRAAEWVALGGPCKVLCAQRFKKIEIVLLPELNFEHASLNAE